MPAPEAKTRVIKASETTTLTLKRSGYTDIDQMIVDSESSSSSTTPRKAPALMARLMGLDDIPVCSPTLSTAEKRRKLLGALERCDEDVKVLKQIIDAVRTSQVFEIASEKKISPVQTFLTPVSIADTITSKAKIRKQKSISPTVMPFATTEDTKTVVAKKNPAASSAKKRFEIRMDGGMVEKCWISWMRWEESGNVLVELEGDIFLDLMDEIVMELDLFCSLPLPSQVPLPLPLDTCRRRLLF